MNLQNPKHRKKLKHYNIPYHSHELTFSCYHRYEYLKDPAVCKIFMEELGIAKEKYQFKLWVYVLMPNHVHILLYPENEIYDIANIHQSFKGKPSTRYRDYVHEHSPEQFDSYCVTSRGKRVFRLWQPGGGFDRNLWNAKAIHSSIQYIVGNPVRAEYVENPEDWHWSSARARKMNSGLQPDAFDVPCLL